MNQKKVIGIAVNVNKYGITVSDGVQEKTYQISRTRNGHLISHQRAAFAALRLFKMGAGKQENENG